MATDVSVRQELIKRGVDNAQIGWNPTTGTVTVGGKDFMKPTKIINNTAFTDPTAFNTAYEQYQKSLQPAQPTQPAQSAVTTVQAPKTGMSATSITFPTTQQTTSQPYDYNAILRNIMESSQNQQPIDPYQTEAYRAAQAQAERARQAQTRAAQEAYGASGFARSSALGERIAGIAGDQQEYLMTQVVPQIIAQEEARRQQQLQNQYSLLDALMRADTQAFGQRMDLENLALNRAGVTGVYQSPQLQGLYNEVLDLKRQWDVASPEQRPAIEARANEVRNLIAAMGGDPSLVGRDVTLEQAAANAPRFGIPTLASQQLQMEAQQQAFNQRMAEEQFAYQQMRDAIADQQLAEEKAYRAQRDSEEDRRWWAQYERDGQQFAARQGLEWAQLNQRQREFMADQAWKQKYFELEQQRQIAAPASGSLTANQFLDSIRNQYLEPVVTDKGISTGETRITTDPARREEMFWQVIDAGYDNATTDQILRALGFTTKEIERLANL